MGSLVLAVSFPPLLIPILILTSSLLPKHSLPSRHRIVIRDSVARRTSPPLLAPITIIIT